MGSEEHSASQRCVGRDVAPGLDLDEIPDMDVPVDHYMTAHHDMVADSGVFTNQRRVPGLERVTELDVTVDHSMASDCGVSGEAHGTRAGRVLQPHDGQRLDRDAAVTFVPM